MLDVCVSFEPIYNGKRRVGNPAFIRFRIFNTIEKMEKSTMTEGANQLFTENNPATPPEPEVKDYPGHWAAQWQALLEAILIASATLWCKRGRLHVYTFYRQVNIRCL